jgi:hypothetical protein
VREMQRRGAGVAKNKMFAYCGLPIVDRIDKRNVERKLMAAKPDGQGFSLGNAASSADTKSKSAP